MISKSRTRFFEVLDPLLKAYEDRFAELNSVIKGLQKQVGDLEKKSSK